MVLDEVSLQILSLATRRIKISDLENKVSASRVTIWGKVDKLIEQGLLKDERGGFPRTRWLEITEAGKRALADELESKEIEIEELASRLEARERANDSGGSIYKTTWLFRDFVHTDLYPPRGLMEALKGLGYLFIINVYRDILKPTFSPDSDEQDYAELLIHVYIDSINFDLASKSDPTFRLIYRNSPSLRRELAKNTWGLVRSFKDPSLYFDYLAPFEVRRIQELLKRPFVKKLEANYKGLLEKECSSAAGKEVEFKNEEDFIKLLCWLRLKERVLGLKRYSDIERQLMVIGLRDLNIITQGYSLERLRILASENLKDESRVSF